MKQFEVIVIYERRIYTGKMSSNIFIVEIFLVDRLNKRSTKMESI